MQNLLLSTKFHEIFQNIFICLPTLTFTFKLVTVAPRDLFWSHPLLSK